jgi:hypothetical protein
MFIPCIYNSHWTFHDHNFFFLGPVCISSGSTSSFKAYCAYPQFLTAQIHYPSVSYKETEVPKWGCAYFFWFHNRFPINIIALSSQCLAATSDMLHCFSLHPAESAYFILHTLDFHTLVYRVLLFTPACNLPHLHRHILFYYSHHDNNNNYYYYFY